MHHSNDSSPPHHHCHHSLSLFTLTDSTISMFYFVSSLFHPSDYQSFLWSLFGLHQSSAGLVQEDLQTSFSLSTCSQSPFWSEHTHSHSPSLELADSLSSYSRLSIIFTTGACCKGLTNRFQKKSMAEHPMPRTRNFTQAI